MYLSQVLSPGVAVELWLFVGFIMFIVIGIAYIHRYYSTKECFTRRQVAEIISMVDHAVDLIANKQSMTQQLAVLETLRRVMNDEAAEQILGVSLSQLYSSIQGSSLRQAATNA